MKEFLRIWVVVAGVLFLVFSFIAGIVLATEASQLAGITLAFLSLTTLISLLIYWGNN